MLNIEENEANNLVRSSLLSLHWVRMAEIDNMKFRLTQWAFKSGKLNVNSGSSFLCLSVEESAILAGGHD